MTAHGHLSVKGCLHESELIDYPNRQGEKKKQGVYSKPQSWQDSSLDPEELAVTPVETQGGHMVSADVLSRMELRKRRE